jgi:hypothetical protein
MASNDTAVTSIPSGKRPPIGANAPQIVGVGGRVSAPGRLIVQVPVAVGACHYGPGLDDLKTLNKNQPTAGVGDSRGVVARNIMATLPTSPPSPRLVGI